MRLYLICPFPSGIDGIKGSSVGVEKDIVVQLKETMDKLADSLSGKDSRHIACSEVGFDFELLIVDLN